MSNRRMLSIAGLVVGVLLVIVAIVWFALPAKDLPGFMGQIDGATVHRTKRGAAALVVGLIILGVAAYELRGERRVGTDSA